MKQYSVREFEQLLTQNGFTHIRTQGGHGIWKRGGEVVTVPTHKLNFMIAKRLIKELHLGTA